jgi:hypothetical protein
MRRIFSFLFFLFVALTISVAIRAQETVVVFDLRFKDGSFSISNPTVLSTGASTNVVFHPTDTLLFFSATELGNNTIKYFDTHQTGFISGKGTYSDLAVTPDGKGLSVLQQNNTGKSDLVKYSLKEGPGVVLMPSVAFTDYAWVDDNSLIALFPGEPNQLKLLSIRPRKETTIAQSVGEVIQRFFSTPSVTFIHKQSFTFSTIKRVGAKDGKIDIVIDSNPEQSIFTWTPREVLISTDGTSLFSFNPKQDHDWKPVVVKDVPELIGISSLSVNATGDKLALTVKTVKQ